MKLLLILSAVMLLLMNEIIAQQNVGVNTTSPQANLHVNGTFKLQNGVSVDGISADSTFTPGSDSLLPTQLAVKKYLQRGLFAPLAGTDSLLIVKDTFTVTNITSLYGEGNYLYVTASNPGRLLIFDISDPDSIVSISSTTTNITYPKKVIVKGNFAYVINLGINAPALAIFNVSNPANIIPLDYTNEGISFPLALDVVGNIAYTGSTLGSPHLTTLDISDPNNIVYRHEYVIPSSAEILSIRVYGNIAYVVSINGKLSLFDVSDPSSIVLLSQIATSLNNSAADVVVIGNYAYVSSPANDRICIFDISNPSNIIPVGFTAEGLDFPEYMTKLDQKLIVQSHYNGKLCVFDISNQVQPYLLYALGGYGGSYLDFNAQQNQVYCKSWLGTNPLAVLEWTNMPRERTLTLAPDGTTTFELSTWNKDNLGNVFRNNGNVGIGTSTPSVALHVSGKMKIDNTNTLEFGAGINGKHQDAGKIGYNTFSGNALDIVGAGASGSRKIKFYAEGGITFEGPAQIGGQLLITDGWLGINNTSPAAPLHLSGYMKIDGGNTIELGAGIPGKDPFAGKIGYQSFSDGLDIVGAGSSNTNRKINLYAEGGAVLQGKLNVTDSLKVNGHAIIQGKLNVTTSMEVDGPTNLNGNLLVNNGWVGINNTSPLVPLHLSGLMKIDGTNTIEFGAGIPGKYSDAGKIGYQTFSGNALDIVGAGTSTSNRRINFYAEGGSEFTGKIVTSDSLRVNGNTKLKKLTVQDSLIVSAPTKLSGNLLVNNGWVGIGNAAPTVPLHLSGLMKIDGTNSLEFGAGVAGKQDDAGKIGYTMYSNALDIIGAGTVNQRRIKLWAEAGVNVEGKLLVTDSIVGTNAKFSGNGYFGSNLVVNGNVGLGTSNADYLLDVNGRMRIRHNGLSAGIFFNKSNNTEEGFVGMFNDNTIGFYGVTGNNWNLVMNTTSGNVGIGTLNPTAALHVVGTQKMQDSNFIEFGAGVANKHPDAGKIGYNTFSNNALDIVGAGTSDGTRTVKIWDNLVVSQIATEAWEDTWPLMQNSWANFGAGFAEGAFMKDPLGVVHLRGTLSGGTTAPGTLLFTLPDGYRPTYGKLIFMVPNNTGFARIEIHPDGNVLFFGSSNVWLSMDQISFKVD